MKLGRRGIGSEKRGRVSRRVVSGSLSVERRTCSFCGHHKVFSKSSGLFCTRCKRRLVL